MSKANLDVRYFSLESVGLVCGLYVVACSKSNNMGNESLEIDCIIPHREIII